MVKDENELMICYENGYIYYATSKRTAREAYDAFLEECEKSKINIDNLEVIYIVLRNCNYDDIDKIIFKK